MGESDNEANSFTSVYCLGIYCLLVTSLDCFRSLDLQVDSSWMMTHRNKGSVMLQQWKIEQWDDTGTLTFFFANEAAEKLYSVSWQLFSNVWFQFFHAIPASFLCFILLFGTMLNPQWRPHSLAIALIHSLILFLETGRCFWDHPPLLWTEQVLSSSSQKSPDHPRGRWIPNPAIKAY